MQTIQDLQDAKITLNLNNLLQFKTYKYKERCLLIATIDNTKRVIGINFSYYNVECSWCK